MKDLHRDTTFAAISEGMAGDPRSVTYNSAIDQWVTLRSSHEQASKLLTDRGPELRRRLELIDKRVALLRAERDYAAKVEIRKLVRGTGTVKHFGLETEGVFGEVKNRGEYTISQLELIFELLDAAGKPVGEKDYTVTYPGVKEPIKPNYTVPFGCAINEPPSDWVAVRGSVKLLRLSRQGLEFPEELEERRK